MNHASLPPYFLPGGKCLFWSQALGHLFHITESLPLPTRMQDPVLPGDWWRNFPPPFLHLWLSQNSSVTRVPSLPRRQVCECLLLTSSTPNYPFLCFVGVEQWAKCIKTKTYLCRELYNLKHFMREFKMVDIPQQWLRNWVVCMYVVSSFLAFLFSKLTTQHTLLL